MSQTTVRTSEAALEKARLHEHLRALRAMSTAELQDTYYDVYGRATPARNRIWLIKRCFFRIQELETGISLSSAVEARIAALSEDVPVRVRPYIVKVLPELPEDKAGPKRDPRLPPAGSTIERRYKGKIYQVKVGEYDLEYAGETYNSPSAVARAITGTNWNGYLFFNLKDRG